MADDEELARLAARAIQAAAMAVPDLSDLRAHMYRKWVAGYIAELRELMGAEWVERECGWPTTGEDD